MKTINIITAILMSIEDFGTTRFSIWNLTNTIRDRINMGDYVLETYNTNVKHDTVKHYFNELQENGLLVHLKKEYSGQGFDWYSNPEHDDADLVGIPMGQQPNTNSKAWNTNVVPTLTIDSIKTACTASKIPFDVQKKMYQYIKDNGPVSMKRLQSRLKGHPYTCKELKEFLAAIGLIDPQSSSYPDSQAFTVKFD